MGDRIIPSRRTKAGKPSVTLCILVMGKPETTEECLYSLFMTDYPDYEIVIVNNGDGSMNSMLHQFQKDALAQGRYCTVILNPTNLGAASGRNLVLRLAQSPYIGFLDNDAVIVSPAWLALLVESLKSDPKVAVVGGKLLFRTRPDIIQSAGGGVSRSGRVCDLGRNQARSSAEYNKARDVQFQSSACMVLKISVVRECGYFDTDFDPVLFEEIDYCYRLRSKGFRIRYVPESEVLHCENTTTLGSASINGRYLFIKHGKLFRERWKHMYEKENGPSDDDVKGFNSRC